MSARERDDDRDTPATGPPGRRWAAPDPPPERPPAPVATDGRARLRDSIRVRLFLLIALPLLSIATLGGLQLDTAMAAVTDAGRARQIASTATTAARLVHEIEREVAETHAYADRQGSSGLELVTAQQARTDAARALFAPRAAATVRAVPGLASTVNSATTALDGLRGVRSLSDGSAQADGYRQAVAAVLAIVDALPAQLAHQDLAERVRAIAAVTAIEQQAAAERDLVRAIIQHRELRTGDLAALARVGATEAERREAFLRAADPEARVRFDRLVAGPDVDQAAGLKAAIFTAETDPKALPADPDAWYIAQSQVIRRLYLLTVELSAALDAAAGGVADQARVRAVTTGAGVVAVLALAFVATLYLAARISRRLRRVRDGARTIVDEQMPGMIGRLTAATDPTRALAAELQAAQRTGSGLVADRPDEIGQVATAFTAVYDEALRLAAGQAVARLDTQTVFLALARRSQVLVQRQLRLIDDLEFNEADPEVLAGLYKLDHLAARMRRVSENLLVLAGTEPARPVTGPVALLDVARGAGAEIEHYARVDVGPVADTSVVSLAAGNLVHLLAELLENATMYSPPSTRVKLTASLVSSGGLRVYVEDFGIGMTPDDLSAANARLASPARLTGALASTMGLLVVASLAARHDITVRLFSPGQRGVLAVVDVPEELLSAPAPVGVGPPGRSRAEHRRDGAIPPKPVTEPDRQQAAPLFRPRRVRARPAAGAPARTGPTPATPVPAEPVPATAAAVDGARGNGDVPAPRSGRGDDLARSTDTRGGVPVVGSGYAGVPAPGSPFAARHAQEEEPPGELTGSGLPLRRPGQRLMPGSAPVPADSPYRDDDPTPDPDEIRARLSALASGVAAARRAESALGQRMGVPR